MQFLKCFAEQYGIYYKQGVEPKPSYWSTASRMNVGGGRFSTLFVFPNGYWIMGKRIEPESTQQSITSGVRFHFFSDKGNFTAALGHLAG